jgi:SsrA-binding protein
MARAAEKGLTLIPLRLYFKRGRVKLELGLMRGRKIWDKRATIADRDAKRDLARERAAH